MKQHTNKQIGACIECGSAIYATYEYSLLELNKPAKEISSYTCSCRLKRPNPDVIKKIKAMCGHIADETNKHLALCIICKTGSPCTEIRHLMDLQIKWSSKLKALQAKETTQA